MIILLRGHIRDFMNKQTLFEFIKHLTTITSIEIYIHTWNIVQSSKSWRRLTENNAIVTEEILYSYFKDLSVFIKHIIIEDDKHIQLVGKTEGNIGKGPCPLIAWKNYWHGQYQIIKYIDSCKENKNEMVLNLRFDLFNCTNNHYFNLENVQNYVTTHFNNQVFNKNVFFKNNNFCGVDNIYIGNINTMYKLIHYFCHQLDEILEQYPNIINQEFLVFDENNAIVFV